MTRPTLASIGAYLDVAVATRGPGNWTFATDTRAQVITAERAW